MRGLARREEGEGEGVKVCKCEGLDICVTMCDNMFGTCLEHVWNMFEHVNMNVNVIVTVCVKC